MQLRPVSTKLGSATSWKRPTCGINRPQIRFDRLCRTHIGDEGHNPDPVELKQDITAEWNPEVEIEQKEEEEVIELTDKEQQMIDGDYIQDPDSMNDNSTLEEVVSEGVDEDFALSGVEDEENELERGIEDHFYADRRPYEDPQELEKSKQFAVAMAFVADEMKCQNIRLLDVHTRRDWTDYFLILSAMSSTQLKAVLGKIEKVAKEEWDMEVQQAVTRRSEWECIDFGTVIIHAFSPRAREYYKIEKLYEKCEEVSIEFQPRETSPRWTASYKTN